MQDAVERSLNSRLQELEAKSAAAEERERLANERLSQTLSQMNVLEAQISCLRAEQTQLTKSYEDHVSQLQEEIRELKTKHKIEHEITPLLQSTIVHEQNSISIKSTHDNGKKRTYLQALLDSCDSLYEMRNPGEVMSWSYVKSVAPNAFKHMPEVLIQNIQSRLPVKESARTSMLSKSWLHAWSTNPTLRFQVRGKRSMKLVHRTLKRYLSDNISIEKFDLKIDIHNQKSASRAAKWIGPVASKTCLKELSLSVNLYGHTSSFLLPDELLLGDKLTKIRVQANDMSVDYNTFRMTSSKHPVIKCVSLRELHLTGVSISEEAFNHILSSCTLLVKIEVAYFDMCVKFKTIKVKRLPCLYELRIALGNGYSPSLEISDVPNLRVFGYNIDDFQLAPWHFEGDRMKLPVPLQFNANTHSMSLSNVMELTLRGVVPDYECLDMITSGFPFLESLTLDLKTWKFKSFHFTCASVKIFSLESHLKILSDVKIYAPKLLSFSFHGDNMPDLLFPVSCLNKIELSLSPNFFFPVDASFFLKMREALTLSPTCDIRIHYYEMPLDIDMDDLRRRLMLPPATNVHQLVFETYMDECLWDRSTFFDAFFEICHPKHVFAKQDTDDKCKHNNYFCRLMLREVLEKKKTAFWTHDLKHVLMRLLPHEEWKTLTNSLRSFLQGSVPVYFKLQWG